MEELVDIGVNLTHASFKDDRAQVIARARQAGVATLILTGTSLAGSRSALELARADASLWATCGVHPHDSRHADSAEAQRSLAELVRDPRCVAIGECGLDFDRDFSPRPVQERVFEAQLALAAAVAKPVFLHERAAHARFAAILARWRPRLSAAVVHCFTGTGEELDVYLQMDVHIGITGWICDERRGLHLRDLMPRVPLERLMLETDAPFLTPRTMPGRGKRARNEPAYLPYVLTTVASAMGLPAAEVAAATTATARRFFALPQARSS
jgi:TatD DNase family protein